MLVDFFLDFKDLIEIEHFLKPHYLIDSTRQFKMESKGENFVRPITFLHYYISAS